MAIFNLATASGLSDRLAAIVQAVDNAVIPARVGAVGVASPGGFFNRVSVTQDYNVESSFITPTYNADNELSGVSILASDAKFQALVQSLDTHTQQVAGVTFDVYCTNSGLRNSEYFAKLYGQVKGVQLSSSNVFAESQVVLASTTGGSGSWAFTAGTDLGAGGVTKYAGTSVSTGAALLIASLPSGISTSNCTGSVSGLDDNGNPSRAAFTFPNGLANAQVQVSSTLRFRTVSNISITTDTGITNGSTIVVFNKKERTITF